MDIRAPKDLGPRQDKQTLPLEVNNYNWNITDFDIYILHLSSAKHVCIY